MKKVLLAVIAIVVIGGIAYAAKLKTANDERAESMRPAATPTPSPEPSNPTPTPSPSNPTPTPTTPTPTPAAPQVKTFNVTGKNFSFSVNEIRVKKGDKVKINFTSTDGLHDWVVDEFNARTDKVNTQASDSVEFTADKTGTFEYYCSVSIHRAAGMKGNLIVE